MNKKTFSIISVFSALLITASALILASCSGEDNTSSSPSVMVDGTVSSSPSVMVNGTVSSGAGRNAIPIAGATVSIFQTQSTSAKLLAVGVADASGNFSIPIPTDDSGSVYYAIATSGTSSQLMALLGTTPLQTVTINEMTTVASAYAMLQFNKNGLVSGPLMSLKIASDMAENLVSAQTGTPSTLIQLPPNANQTNTWRELGSLANILTSCVRALSGACETLFANSSSLSGIKPETTLQAISNIALNPGASLGNLFALSNKVLAYSPYLLSIHGPDSSDIEQSLDSWTLSV